MPTNTKDELVASLLSQAAYKPLINYQNGKAPPLPEGWVADIGNSGYTGLASKPREQFITFYNAQARQVAIVFKGSNTFANYASDLLNSGASAYAAIEPQASEKLAAIQNNPAYQNCRIFTDGHSLGGGMAQTFALQHDLDGCGQNSLPIAPDSIKTYFTMRHIDFKAALAEWTSKHSFVETNMEGDPATWFYEKLKKQFYLDPEAITLYPPASAPSGQSQPDDEIHPNWHRLPALIATLRGKIPVSIFGTIGGSGEKTCAPSPLARGFARATQFIESKKKLSGLLKYSPNRTS